MDFDIFQCHILWKICNNVKHINISLVTHCFLVSSGVLQVNPALSACTFLLTDKVGIKQ